MSDKKNSDGAVRTAPQKSFLFKAILAILLVLILLVAGLWIWSGSSGSFATALSFAQGRLPVKSLTVSDVQASLRSGGHIGNIHIEQNDGSSIILNDVNVDWNLLDLLKKQLIVEQLSVQKVQILRAPEPAEGQEETPQEPAPSPQEPTSLPQPPDQIMLPLRIDLKQLQINQIVQGKEEHEIASNIHLSYQFDGSKHTLLLNSAHLADGDYQGNLTLTAQKPELDANFKGVLTTQVPQSNQNVTINADTKIHGPLTLLNVMANAQAATNAANSSKVVLQGSIAPWAAVKIPEADLDLQAFNAKAFWTQAPETLLSGTVKMATSDQEKTNVALDLKNTIPGAIDLAKLPVSAVTGTLIAQGHEISFNKLDVKLGSGTASFNGNVQLPQASSGFVWQTSIKLTSVDPHGIYSQVASDRLSGNVALTQKVANNIGFDVDITAANASNIPLFRVKHFVTHGTFFVGNRVVFNSLTANSVDAQVQGKNVSYALNSGAASGALRLTAPGLGADATLNAFAKTSGSARLVVDIQDTEKAAGWLTKQPIKLGSLPEFVQKAARYTKNLSAFVKDIPVTLNNGWEKPHVQVDLDLNAIIAKIIEQEGKDKLLERLGLPEQSQEGEKPRQQIEREAINRLGDLLNRRK